MSLSHLGLPSGGYSLQGGVHYEGTGSRFICIFTPVLCRKSAESQRGHFRNLRGGHRHPSRPWG
jgi:hypothetical protein